MNKMRRLKKGPALTVEQQELRETALDSLKSVETQYNYPELAKKFNDSLADDQYRDYAIVLEPVFGYKKEEAKKDPKPKADDSKTETTKDKLLNIGLKIWSKSGNERIYINDDKLEVVFGLSISRYKSGSISKAELNGEKISNSKASKLTANKIFYCLKSNTFFGTSMDCIL